MKKCIRCGGFVRNENNDLCYSCWEEQETEDETTPHEEHFESNLDNNKINTVYVMFYGNNDNKVGYTKDLNSRIIEIKRRYPKNEFVYFREFVNESQARRFEKWLKELSERELIKFVSSFQDKIKKIKLII